MTDDGRIRVLLVDDHTVVRRGLRLFLDLQKEIEVVGEATNGQEGVEMAARLQPDVVLMDLVMPVLDGIQATQRLKQALPGTHVIVLTSFSDEDKVVPAIQAGATGYLLKDVQPGELVAAIKGARAGRPQLHPDVALKMMRSLAAPPRQPDRLSHLSPREQDVLRAIARGQSNKEIAAALVISEKTVKTHVSSILSKLGLQDRTQAAVYAVEHGLVSR